MTLNISLETLMIFIFPCIIVSLGVILSIYLYNRKDFLFYEDSDSVVLPFLAILLSLVAYSVIAIPSYHNLKFNSFDLQTRELIINLNKNPNNHAKVIDDFLSLYPNYSFTNDESPYIKISDEDAAKKFRLRNRQDKENNTYNNYVYEKLPK